MSESFTPADKQQLVQYISEITGLDGLQENLCSQMLAKVAKRMEAKGANSVDTYIRQTKSDIKEYREFANLVLIPSNGWFKTMLHFDKLKGHLDSLKGTSQNYTYRALVVDCGTGEELYSLALLFLQYAKKNPQFRFQLLGLDYNYHNVKVAQSALYPASSFRNVPRDYQEFLIQKSDPQQGDVFTFPPQILQNVQIKNQAVGPTPLKVYGPFDLIFCRSRMSHLSPSSAQKLIELLQKNLHEKGLLCVGSTEDHLFPDNAGLVKVWGGARQKLTDSPISGDESDSSTEISILREKRPTVLILDDSPIVLKTHTQIFQRHGFKAMATTDPQEANHILKRHDVHLISLDINMPQIDGPTWLKYVRQGGCTVPCVVVTEVSAREAVNVLKILENGAQDYISKQVLKSNEESVMSKIKALLPPPFNHLMSEDSGVADQEAKLPPLQLFRPQFIVIGASTGGVEALNSMLASFPAQCPPIIVVQHISPQFSEAFAVRLANVSKLKLATSLDRTPLLPGHIYTALGDYHIKIARRGSQYQLETSTQETGTPFRPSVDVLFKSAVQVADKCAAILLTGMGSDGAVGLSLLKERGALTFAQDKKSSVVFGMPKEAIRMGAAKFIGAPHEIRHQILMAIHSRN